jgi:hypothetical protein
MNLTIIALALGSSVTLVGGQLAKTDTFTLDGSQGTCTAGAECKVDLTLTAAAGFHVNKDYPYKFKANDVAGVEFTGTDAGGKNVFSKASGDFAPDPKDEHVGVMHVHFKAAKAGSVALSGTYKLAVCTADNCQFKPVDISMAVTIK